MSSTIEILRNANRLVLDQLDAADERIKAKETEARQTLDTCVTKRESIKRKRQLIQEIERVQLESIAEIEEAEALVADIQEHRVPERVVNERIVNERIPERHVMPERHIAPERIMVPDAPAAAAQPARIADRLAFAVVKASQASPQLKR
jgi:hypothetical protein